MPRDDEADERNARFWIVVNGSPAKLTLRPGQTIQWSTGGPTEEGWSSESRAWTYDFDDRGEYVTESFFDDGRDCDGRLSQGGEIECPVERLARGRAADADLAPIVGRWPDWKASKTQYAVFDEFAVAAGY